MTAPSTSAARVPFSAHLKELIGQAAIYGSQDVAAQVVNLLLTPLYTAILSAADYGVIAILFTFSTVAKVVFRMGLDAGFFRIYYDLESDQERAIFMAEASALIFSSLDYESTPSTIAHLAASNVWAIRYGQASC